MSEIKLNKVNNIPNPDSVSQESQSTNTESEIVIKKDENQGEKLFSDPKKNKVVKICGIITAIIIIGMIVFAYFPIG